MATLREKSSLSIFLSTKFQPYCPPMKLENLDEKKNNQGEEIGRFVGYKVYIDGNNVQFRLHGN